MTKIIHWKSIKKGFLKYSLDLFLDDVLFGTITDKSFKTPIEINGRKYVIVQANESWTAYPKRHMLLEFENKKVVCDIEYHYEDRQVFAVFPDKLKYDITPGTGNPSQTNGLIIQNYGDSLWFPTSGKLEVRTDKNIEALIICYFFADYLDSSGV